MFRADRRDPRGAARRGRTRPVAPWLLAATLLSSIASAGVAALPPDAPAAPAAPRPAGAASPGAARDGTPGDTRLVVLLVVDQFRADYLDRLLPRFGPDGFRRLLNDGFRCTACAYPYAVTETAPGHATLASGTTPDRHGIVGNEWYDQALGRTTEAVEDTEFPLLGAGGPGVSPRRLLAETLGDALRRATRDAAKVWAVAGKDRSAIFSAGLHPSGALWYDKRNGRMTSSRYYAPALPAWARRFNGSHPAERLLRDVEVKDFASLRSTPQFNELLLDCARALIVAEGLGRDATPDLLAVSLSATDFRGHEVGPFDDRQSDLILRLDAQIAAFLRFLDDRVGVGRTIVALSSDHGVSPTREQAIAQGLKPLEIDRPRLRATIQRAVAAAMSDGRAAPKLYGQSSTRIWFDDDELGRAVISRQQAAEIAGEAAAGIEGIIGFVTPGRSTVDAALTEAYRLSRHAGRSPDLFLVPAEFVTGGTLDPASHGSPWPYDRRVPLILAGSPFRHAESGEACSPADVAPTLASVLGIPPPREATGRVLTTSLRR